MIADAHRSATPSDGTAVGGIAVPNEMVRRLVPGKGLGDVVRNPLGCRMIRDAERDQSPALVPENDQDEQQAKANRRNNEKVHRRDTCRMIAQEGLPSL